LWSSARSSNMSIHRMTGCDSDPNCCRKWRRNSRGGNCGKSRCKDRSYHCAGCLDAGHPGPLRNVCECRLAKMRMGSGILVRVLWAVRRAYWNDCNRSSRGSLAVGLLEVCWSGCAKNPSWLCALWWAQSCPADIQTRRRGSVALEVSVRTGERQPAVCRRRRPGRKINH